MPRVLCGIFAVCSFFSLALGPVRAQDDVTPFQQAQHYVVVGVVQSVNGANDRLVLNGNDFQRYVVDAYGADITLLDSRLGETSNLARGMRLRVVGTLLGRNLLEADRLHVLPAFAGAGPQESPAPIDALPAVADPLPVVDAVPVLPLPVPVIATSPQPQFTLDGLIRGVDAPHNQVTLLSDDDKRYTADTLNTDIILRGTERAGLTADLAQGMRVHLVGVLLPSGLVEADRIRVLPAASDPPVAAPVAAPVPVAENMDAYTGILIDCRSLPNISRSPAPAIYATAPGRLLTVPRPLPCPDTRRSAGGVHRPLLLDRRCGVQRCRRHKPAHPGRPGRSRPRSGRRPAFSRRRRPLPAFGQAPALHPHLESRLPHACRPLDCLTLNLRAAPLIEAWRLFCLSCLADIVAKVESNKEAGKIKLRERSEYRL